MELSKRLKTVAQAVTPGLVPADVGTDHGYVPIYLVKQGICPKAFAMDINPGPLSRAKDHIIKEGLEDKITTILSNGLEQLDPKDADSIIIAGMGGDLICKILTASPEFMEAGKELILSPQAEWFKVRRILHNGHYAICREWFLKEDGKYYVVIKACPENDSQPCPAENHQSCPAENHQFRLHDDHEKSRRTQSLNTIWQPFDEETCYQYGRYLLEEKNPVLFEYLEKEREKKKAILAGLRQQGKVETSRYRELLESVMVIDNILKT